MIAASITEPAVGASVCASGSQVCSGHKGTLIQKAKANARNNQNSVRGEITVTLPRKVSTSTV
jgi:hypothetical protein